jgi:hypothetical protein
MSPVGPVSPWSPQKPGSASLPFAPHEGAAKMIAAKNTILTTCPLWVVDGDLRLGRVG